MDTKLLALELRKEAEKLLKAAEALEGNSLSEKVSFPPLPPQSLLPQAKRTREQHPKIIGTTRIEQLRNLLKISPMAFDEILKAGIPRGTASSLMTNENGFTKDSSGKWTLKNNLSI